ncbi:ABC-F family ATP-binding cassette domain-containing protein [Aquibacillus koreensis]|uniref:ABC-F family ATP-binding cassette domain-containing protein n=1 Tax=Aquibacillus koreensis TaxID=279446 RepID=A0A9X4AIB7_9BACI|nr:ABC-F family ATP-binding cassette domain-containing protein [Aquibacillus koreensis]MCT2538235.1 ABC-F family ATP-binding cassette domain-containing protein [Aquibacillus koreensis]MDC3420821.1 ABC-F family ATP-binding cassette domain-containing protein [Aquibacillus koreensis]
MTILSVENLYKSYGEKVLFDSITFSITAKERIGLIGVNGTGKSTLLKVLAGIESSEAGTIKHANDFRVEYLSQEPELDHNLTVFEQIYYGDSPIMVAMRNYERTLMELEQSPEDPSIQKKQLAAQQQMDQLEAWDANTTAKTILTRLGVTSFDKIAGELSGGQKKRVAIARALIQPADLLILDEPTNHLDNQTIDWLESYIPQYKGSIILVTHDRYFLNRITNKIYELDKGNLYQYEGNYETFLEKKAEREELEIQNEQKHKNTLKRELEWLRRGAKARTTKQKARIERAEQLKEKTFDTVKQDLDFQIGSTRLGNKVIELEGIGKSFQGTSLIKDFSFLITPNDRIGIIGPNGSGKSTLLNIMAERIQPDTGTLDKGETVKIGYYTQDHSEMDEDLKIIDYIREEAEVVHTAKGDVITAEQMLERFLFPRSQQWTYIRKLSGGERRRLYLLRVLMGEPNVLFLDEPTNDLDTQTLGVLEDYLDQFPGVVITVSHDRYFLDRVVDQLIAFEHGQIKPFYGNYSEYLEQVVLPEKQEQSKASKKQAEQAKPKRKKLSYKDQKDWETIEDTITALEQKLENMEQLIADAGSDLGKVTDLYKEQSQVEQELEAAMERWTELSLLVEEIENSK